MTNNDNPPNTVDADVPEDDPGVAISLPESGNTGEGGKLKMMVQLVKKCLGVKDIATMRLSLPASLLEPIPNLEYWHYLDRPDLFAAINDSNDPFERMLMVLRFTFTKDLRFIHGKVCKPYNSVLGEHFRAHWDVPPVVYGDDSSPLPQTFVMPSGAASIAETSSFGSVTPSVKSGISSKSTQSGLSLSNTGKKSPSTATSSITGADVSSRMSKLHLTSNDSYDDNLAASQDNVRVVFVTEQISHHPPVSAYIATCPSRHLEMSGIDQISARVSGTTLRVVPGNFSKGIFIDVKGGYGEGEKYHITYPAASVNGILRGSFYITFGESSIITCTGGKSGTKFRSIIEYKEESWLGRAHYLVEGVIHTVHEGDAQHEEWTKVKHVPQSRVVAVFDGSWRGSIRWKRAGLGSYPPVSSSASSPSPSHTQLPTPQLPSASLSKAELSSRTGDGEYSELIDLSSLRVVPKDVRPLEKQLPYESRKLWEKVTGHLLRREFGDATKEKMAIEQNQRDEAAERKRKGAEFIPRYFEQDISSGYPTLTPEGWKAVQEELEEESSF